MRCVLILAALVLTSVSAQAQAPTKSEPPATEILGRVLAVAEFSGGTRGSFRAVLVEGEPDEADLYFFDRSEQASGQSSAPARLLVAQRGFAFNSPTAGQTAELSVNQQGSLIITSGNSAIGRDRWNQKVTIAVRGGVPVVAGLTLTHRDTLDPNANLRCDINFLTGRGTVNNRAITTGVQAPELATWNAEAAERFCR